MSRRFIIPALAAMTAGLVAVQPQPAQAGFFDLFRKPEQAAPPPADLDPGGPGSQDIRSVPMQVQSTPSEAQAALRMDRIEQQMRTLTGQVEDLTYQVHQLQEQLRGGGTPHRAAPASAAPTPPPRADNAPDPLASKIEAQSDVPPATGPGAPPQPLGQITIDPTNPQPLDLGALGNGAPTEPPAMTGNPRSDYDAAYDLVLKGDYDVAEASFRRFLASYPGDPLAADAQYWLGESLYARQDYRGAADALLAGYQTYPKSAKAPDMLLKLGLSLYGLGQREAACSTYSEILKKYPKSSNALIQRVKTEQVNASC